MTGGLVLALAVIATTVAAQGRPAPPTPPTAGRERDPFAPPSVPTNVRSASPRMRGAETRLSEVALDGVVLTGAACTDARQAAVIRSLSGRAWVVAAGDRLRDARVARVTCDAVMFERSAGARASREVWRYLRRRLVSP